jgi:hypothetical protein
VARYVINKPLASAQQCVTNGCTREARAAVRVTRPNLNMQITLFPDNRTAPKTAVRYCRTCMTGLMRELIDMTVAPDG